MLPGHIRAGCHGKVGWLGRQVRLPAEEQLAKPKPCYSGSYGLAEGGGSRCLPSAGGAQGSEAPGPYYKWEVVENRIE